MQQIWRPYTQMKTAEPPAWIDRAEGALLYSKEGHAIIDGISSWWVNLHGHAHPRIAAAIAEQASQLEHVIFAGFTHAPAERLTAKLIAQLPEGQNHVFFSDNGSTAVEVALKMAIQSQGPGRQGILAFEHAYHGDTFGAMSVSGASLFTAPFSSYLFDVQRIPAPTPGREAEALDCLNKHLKQGSYSAFIFEPLIQGTAGMVVHCAQTLSRMMDLCHQYQVITIADEVMTGFGVRVRCSPPTNSVASHESCVFPRD